MNVIPVRIIFVSRGIIVDALISHIYFVMNLYMFRTVRLSIVRSLFTVHSAMVFVIQVCRQLSSRSICSCSKAVYKPVWHMPLLSVQWINSRRWTDELSETCRVSWQNKFVKIVYLLGFPHLVIMKYAKCFSRLRYKVLFSSEPQNMSG